MTFPYIYVGASEFSGLRLRRFAGGVALSCSCVSGVVFSLLDLFLGVGFAGLGRTGEEDFFFRFWERGGGLGL